MALPPSARLIIPSSTIGQFPFLLLLVFICNRLMMTSADAAPAELLQSSSSPTNNVSSHVLDIALGQPAEGIACTAYKLIRQEGNILQWELWGRTRTNALGRIPIVHPGQPLTSGQYKLHFDTKEYFERQQRATFYPYIEIVFQIEDPTVHYHVPITLSNFGYSTYKGQ